MLYFFTAKNIFTEKVLALTDEDCEKMEKAVNEIVKLIKRTKIDALVAKADSVEMLTELINEKKNVDNLYIKL